MKLRRFALLLALVVGLCTQLNAQYQKYIDKIDDYYEEGDYDNTLKNALKLQAKAAKKLGESNNFTALGLIYEGKAYIGLGELVFVVEAVEEGVAMSLETNGELSSDHGFALLEATDVMIIYGHFRLAEEYNEKASEAFESSGSLIEDIKAKMDVQKAQILSGKGFYQEAIDLADSRADYYLQRALNASGSKSEIREQQSEYGELMIVKANSLRKMGDFKAADEQFQTNMRWVEDNLKRTHFLWGKNAFLNAKLLEENGLSIEAQRKLYEDAYSLAERKYEPTHRNVMLVRAELMRTYYADNKRSKLNILRNDFKKAVRSFDKTSIFRLEDVKLDMEFDLADANIDRIEEAINEMLTLEALPDYHQERIELLEMVRNVGLLSGKHKNTEAYENAILDVQAELIGTDAPEYHLTKVRIANYYVEYTDNLKEAEQIYEESFNKIVKPEIVRGHKDYLTIMNHLAKYYQDIDKYKKASEILEEALLVSREKYDNQDIEYGKELSKIADLQINIGEYDKADENIEEAIDIISNSDVAEAPSYLASAYITLSKLMAIEGEYDEAEELIYDSDKLREQGALSLESVANVSLNEDLAGLYLNLGRYTDAQELLKVSIDVKEFDFGKDSRQLNNPYVLSSRLNLIQGDYSEAEQLAKRANTISLSIYGDESSKIVPSMLQLADVYMAIGDFDKAEGLVKNSLEIQRSTFGDEHIDVANSTSKLALVYFYQGKPISEVQELFQESERIIGVKLGSSNPTYADILKNMAISNTAAGNYSLAFSYIGQAESIWAQKIGKRNNINAATAMVLKGDIFYLQKNYEEAEDYYSNAKKQFEKVFNETHPEYVKVLSKLGKTYYMQSRYKDSQGELDEVLAKYKTFIKEYFPALSEGQKAKFWNTIKGDYEFYNTLIINHNKSNKYIGELYNNALLTKALLLNSSIKVRQRIMNSNDDELIGLYNQWKENKELLTAALSMSASDLEKNGINTQGLISQVEQLEKDISLKSELFAESSDNDAITWENVQSSLNTNEVAVEMVRFRVFDHVFTDSIMYALLYVKGGKRSAPEMILLGNGKELEKRYLNTYRNSIKYKIQDKYSYEKFWKPIKDAIGNVPTMYMSPDGVYNQINLEAIPTPEGNYVLDNSNIVLISNTKDLYINKTKTRPISDKKYAMMFGNPNFYATTQPGVPLPGSGLTRSTAEVVTSLPGTEKEIKELNDLLDTRGWDIDSFTENKATEDAIKQVSNPRIFHVATHGFFQSKPKASALDEAYNESAKVDNPLLKTGLLFSGAGDILNTTRFNYNVDDGILTAYEAMNLNLDQTDLVVLSACETGLGELEAGEGVYGLQRSFLVAGARTIVMSLFKVSDEATQQLMVKFYRNWLETGNKRQSFIDAKKEIRNEYRDPIYWGPFVMIGLD